MAQLAPFSALPQFLRRHALANLSYRDYTRASGTCEYMRRHWKVYIVAASAANVKNVLPTAKWNNIIWLSRTFYGRSPTGTLHGLMLLAAISQRAARRGAASPAQCAELLEAASLDDLSASVRTGGCAFIKAACRDEFASILLPIFLAKGQSINVVDNEGGTALHMAVWNGGKNRLASVRALLDAGIDATIKDREYSDSVEECPAQTALDLAEDEESTRGREERHSCAVMLRAHLGLGVRN